MSKGGTMTGIVVRTVEELKAVGQERAYPTIIIEGELANNLLISGVVRTMDDGRQPQGEILAPTQPDSLFYPITQVLKHLSHSNEIEVVEDDGRRRIKIYPRPLMRREGN
jgi:hypothetical protein